MEDQASNISQSDNAQKLRHRNNALLISLFAVVIILYSLAIVRMKGLF